jgi:catechol 2,3-dioxygenase-like lactoylglutathione lyase family enzyme
MTSGGAGRLKGMSNSTQVSTITNIGIAMFTVSDQDASIAFYTEKLGFEVRADISFGEGGPYRWVEVAPPGSTARLALNQPMDGTPGGTALGLETKDLDGEHARLLALDGVDVDPEIMAMEGTPRMFSLRDPDQNHLWVVEV